MAQIKIDLYEGMKEVAAAAYETGYFHALAYTDTEAAINESSVNKINYIKTVFTKKTETDTNENTGEARNG